MNKTVMRYENQFEVTIPSNWTQQSAPCDHLIATKSPEENFIVRRTPVQLFGGRDLEQYLQVIISNITNVKNISNVEVAPIEDFHSPKYAGKSVIFTYTLHEDAMEMAAIAFETENYFYALLLNTLGSCSDTLNDYFDMVNSFTILEEEMISRKQDVTSIQFKKTYDAYGKISILMPEDWVDISSSYTTKGSYAIFVSSGDRNQVVGVSEIPQIKKSDGIRLAQIEQAIRPFEGLETEQGDYYFFEINGFPSLQYEIKAAPQSIPLAYLNTIIETEEKYYFISCWAPQGLYQDFVELFQHMVGSFTLS